jgi:nucleoside-diphosphate-sugar epimerase
MPKPHDGLRVIQGDILDLEPVQRAMIEQEAVCVAIGIGITWKPVTVFSQGTRNVLEAMRRQGFRRLICISGIGAGDSKGHGGFLDDRLCNPLLLKTIYQDKNRQETLIRASETEWTIVRPGFLTNGPLTEKYRCNNPRLRRLKMVSGCSGPRVFSLIRRACWNRGRTWS